eukprot:TRINITY_DN7289_c0_g1_i4.p1 TRINITY_DN7289_c0_g1~~TRINITY_DN7289_c0_g1_i4.p1  ORF type:complete len:706 (-),score=143.81 TRINITY_DN7289_c0_g1_i4:247-2364(-)
MKKSVNGWFWLLKIVKMGLRQKIQDRFKRLVTDPRFKKHRNKQSKSTIDKERFGALFTDSDFQLGTTQDKRGAQNSNRQNVKEDLRRYYQLDDNQDSLQVSNQKINQIKEKEEESLEDGNEQGEEGEDVLDDKMQKSMMRMRGMLNNESEEELDGGNEEDGSEIEQELSEDEVDLAEWGAGADAANPEEDVPLVENSTNRLAVLDLDWSKVRAVDILSVIQSFVPTGGRILQVAVYPSDYGLEQMEREKSEGPRKVFQNALENGNEDEEDESVDDRTRQRLVMYERSKLRWYYAVISCDEIRTAEVIYNECDGLEFEGTACKFDFRFVPDQLSFQGRQIRDFATEVPLDYKPPLITGQVPIHTNPALSWDKDCDVRKNALKFNKKSSKTDMEFDDFKAYLASSSSEGEEEAVKRVHFKNLLLDQDGKKQEGWDTRFGAKTWGMQNDDEGEIDMEVKFIPTLESVNLKANDKTRENVASKGLPIWQQRQQRLNQRNLYLRKQGKYVDEENDDQLDEDVYNRSHNFETGEFFGDRSDDDQGSEDEENGNVSKRQSKKKKRKKEIDPELELLTMDDNKLIEAVRKGNQDVVKADKEQRKKKRKKASSEDEAETMEFDASDARFQSLFNNPEFGVDPSDPKYNDYSKRVIQEITKRRNLLQEKESCGEQILRNSLNDGQERDGALKLQVQHMKHKFKHRKQKMGKKLVG